MASEAGRGDLTDDQWARLGQWVPEPSVKGRPVTRSRRALFNGVAWRVRVGSPWQDVPEHFGPWPTVYWLFRRSACPYWGSDEGVAGRLSGKAWWSTSAFP
ncbi:transposase [Glycomyces harbinensis]|uniref:transposase n=1 Tax=Glycomyces harbinensis TaxID=58114 RepID=UPI0015A699BB